MVSLNNQMVRKIPIIMLEYLYSCLMMGIHHFIRTKSETDKKADQVNGHFLSITVCTRQEYSGTKKALTAETVRALLFLFR